MKYEPKDSELIEALGQLREVPERNIARAAEGRRIFLEEARNIRNSVSNRHDPRLKKWISISLFRKEPIKMPTFAVILLIVALVFGSTGATVAAAQSSLPDDALYPVKLLTEDARLGIAGNDEAGLQLALEFSSRRALEIQKMAQIGKEPPISVLARYQNQLEQVVRLAQKMPDDSSAIAVMIQVRQQIMEQDRIMAQTPNNQAEGTIKRVREMLQNQLQVIELGLEDPTQFRQQARMKIQIQTMTISPQQPTNSSQQPPRQTIGAGNPWTTGTPTPGSGYGPGTNDCAGCTPTKVGNGGNNPWTTGTPTPGSSYGPGPGSNPSATPGTGAGPGPQPTVKPGGQNGNPTQPGQIATKSSPQNPTQAPPQPTQGKGGGKP
ncbi:MAG TPA: DUF5667 domain-containing protein [Anaerolineaceae bacterium]